jgi:hypothetical protein
MGYLTNKNAPNQIDMQHHMDSWKQVLVKESCLARTHHYIGLCTGWLVLFGHSLGKKKILVGAEVHKDGPHKHSHITSQLTIMTV